MSLSANTVWEVRTTGSDASGGGFVAGATGTDRSQANTAFANGTNLTVDGATNTDVAPDSYSPVAADIGNIIQITTTGGGAAFTVGFYEIKSIQAGKWRLDRSPAAIASAGASWAMGGALASLVKLGPAMVSSNKAFVKSGSYSQGVSSNFSANLVSTSPTAPPTSIIGYFQARGDIVRQADGSWSNNANRPTFTATAGIGLIGLSGAGWWVQNLILDAGGFFLGTGIAISSVSLITVLNCYVKNSGNSGGGIGISSSGGVVALECEFSGGANGSSGAIICQTPQPGNACIDCYFHDILFGAGIRLDGGGMAIVGNVFANNTASAPCISVFNGSFSFQLINNTFYRCNVIGSAGTSSAHGWVIRNNIIAMSTGYGLVGGSVAGNPARPNYDGNFYWSNTSGPRNNLDDAGSAVPVNAVVPYTNVSDVLLSADPFVDRLSGDFRLNTTAGGGAAVRGAGWPRVWPGNTLTVGRPDGGAAQHLEVPADYPAVGNVRFGISYDFGAMVGTNVLPAIGTVQVGIQYGAAGTEFTGTYAAVCDYPVVGDVELGVVYNFGILTGAFVVPDEGNVRYGTGYGDSGTEFTGTAGLILPPTPGLPPPTTPVFAERIAIAAVAKILTLPPQPVPIPSLVEFRKADKIHPGEAPCVIVTIGGELPAEGAGGFQLQGAGTPHDYGTVGKRYLIGISIYTESQGAMSTGTGEHPALVTRIKQAFDAPTLDGADSWWGCKIHQNIEWEQQFQNGAEVSRFVLEALSQEPRNG